nr:MAG TPA: hypothetical protein [Caudoviricetes sp.]
MRSARSSFIVHLRHNIYFTTYNHHSTSSLPAISILWYRT